MLSTAPAVLKRLQVIGLLERICETLELSESQYKLAKERYEAIGGWLDASDHPLLRHVEIYPQGSISLGTTTKPLAREEYDLDLVCHVPSVTFTDPPSSLKGLIGDRLRSHDHYRKIMEEKPRCWRLNYANEFHLDITPSIPNPGCDQGGEFVPDKPLRRWIPSNPKGYRRWFEDQAKLQPTMQLVTARVDPLPEPVRFKGILKRCVQLLKRHRDVYFSERDTALAPISIIITTLAATSYAHCISRSTYDTDLEVLMNVVRHMDRFVERQTIQGHERYAVWNPTTRGENFAEKWNQNAARATVFFQWHKQVLQDMEKLVSIEGLDGVSLALKQSFGERAVSQAMTSYVDAMTSARTNGRLAVTPGIGLISPSHGVRVQPNTFFGARR